jgi:riboflavin synthase
MFTGLIEAVGRLAARDPREGGARLRIEGVAWSSSLQRGESVAVEGVCLTVTQAGEEGFVCDLLQETCQRTTLGQMPIGRRLNLERALTPSSRLGGHFVTGHVDGMGEVSALRRTGSDWVLEVAPPDDLRKEIARKGSIAINGVSLTVARCGTDRFEVHLIPFTWSHTSLSDLGVGDRVNLETDLIAKYVRRLLQPEPPGGLTWERLTSSGFL